jgi:hypothetical protein
MATTVEQVVNNALILAGRLERIGDIYQGSAESIVALEIYEQTRDELQRDRDWQFSRLVAPLVLLKGPPPNVGYNPMAPWTNVYPAPGYLYEYTYPSNCLSLRAIIAPPAMMPDTDPLPSQWRIDTDNSYSPPVKVIMSNTTNAIAIYRAQIKQPTSWDAGFTKSLIEALADKFLKAFGDNINQQKEQDAISAQTTETTSMVRG